MRLDAMTAPDLIFSDLPGSDQPTVLRAMADRLSERGLVTDADDLYSRLWEREGLGSTGIGSGVAIPHCKMDGLRRVILAIGVTAKEVDYAAIDGQPVRVLFLIISPADAPASHLKCLAAISKWVKDGDRVAQILAQPDAESIYRLVSDLGEA